LKVTIRGHKNSSTLYLRARVNGRQIDLSTGLKDTKQNRAYLSKNAESEFWKVYQKRYPNAEIPQVAVSMVFEPKPQVETISFLEYAEYIKEISGEDRNKFSEKDFEHHIKARLEFFHNLDIANITASTVKEWQNELLKSGKSAKSVINYRSTLSKVLKYAVADGLLRANPLGVVKAPIWEKPETIAYNLKDVDRLLWACEEFAIDSRNAPDRESWRQFKNMLIVGFFSGLRSGELIALKWADIDFEANEIHLQRRIRHGDIDLPKKGKKRNPYLFIQAKEALKEQQKRTGLQEWVWLTYKKEPYTCSSRLDKMFKKACDKAGLKVGRFYAMRASFATLMIELNQNPAWIQQHLGHSSFSTTLKSYTGKLKPNLEAVNNAKVG